MTDTVAAFEEKIAPELQSFARPIGDATLHPDNVRKHKIEKIAQSLNLHGQRALIVVQASTGYIVKGNGTHTAAGLLGWQNTAQIWQDMTDEEALSFLYADNRASDLASYDREKLRAGLSKLMAGPGLFDTLWEIEEFEDLDEEMRGQETLAAAGTDATYATADGEALVTTEPRAPGEKMKEIPIVLTAKDYPLFIERIRLLQKRFGTGGTIATIFEAVRRQAEAESANTVETGRSLTEEAEYAARRGVVREIDAYIQTMGPDRSYSGSWLVAQLNRMVPYRAEPAKVAEGQVAAFEEADTAGREAMFTLPKEQPFDIPADPALAEIDAIADES